MFPEYIRAQVQSVDLDEVWKRVQIVYAKDGGQPSCRYKDGDCWIHMNSEKPVVQAQNWANPLGLEDLGTLFVYRSGFGYVLTEVLNRAHSDSVVVVFEREIHIFIAMLHVLDLRPLFQKHSKCIFFVGDAAEVTQHFSVLLLTQHMYSITKPAVVYAHEA